MSFLPFCVVLALSLSWPLQLPLGMNEGAFWVGLASQLAMAFWPSGTLTSDRSWCGRTNSERLTVHIINIAPLCSMGLADCDASWRVQSSLGHYLKRGRKNLVGGLWFNPLHKRNIAWEEEHEFVLWSSHQYLFTFLTNEFRIWRIMIFL